MPHKSLYALLVICLCFSGLASIPSIPAMPAPSLLASQSEGAFKLKVEVDLTTIEVMALDRDGKPVRNLKKEDFSLYEDGKRQEIYSVDEINAETKASSLGANLMDENALLRGKTVLIIFDDASIQPQYIRAARESAAKFVKEHMRPQDVFAVATYGMSLQILQNFTHDPEDVLRAIEKPAAANAGTGAIYFENLLRALNNLTYSMARIKGQKSLVIYSQPMMSSQPVESRMPGLRMEPRATIPSTLDSTYRNTVEAARKANMVIYTVDPGSLASPDPGIGLSIRSFSTESGGFSIRDTNRMEAELGRLDQQLSNYYVLSFQSSNPKHNGGFRKIDVRSDIKGLVLKHREGVPDRSPIDALASEKQEKNLMTALASPDAARRIPVSFRPMYFYSSARISRVLIAARIRMDKPVFRKKGSQMGADLNLMGVAYGEDGSVAARFSETLPVRFDKDKESSYRKNTLGYRNYFMLRPGKYRLRFAVSDESNNVGVAEQTLEVPALPGEKLAGSSIIVVEKALKLPDLIQNLQNQLYDENDPLIYSGMQIEPGVANRFSQAATIPVIFHLYHLPAAPASWELTAKVKLLGEKGKEYALDPIPLKKSASSLDKEDVAIGLPLAFPSAVPGKYRLIIEATETVSGQSAVLQTDLELVPGPHGTAAQNPLQGGRSISSQTNESRISLHSESNGSVTEIGTPTKMPVEWKTVMAMTVDELRKHYPLKPQEMVFSENPEDLKLVLRKAGERVHAFFRDFSDTSSKEQVLLRRYESGSQQSERQNYNYLILYRPSNSQPVLEEYRTDDQNRRVEPNEVSGFVMTSGYGCVSILFHPEYQKYSNFRYLGKQNSGDRAHVVVFAQNQQSEGSFVYKYRDNKSGISVPIPLQGMVWLDPETYQILRIRTNMLNETDSFALTKQTMDIKFSEVRFEDARKSIWMPREVNVDMMIDGRSYENYHLYSDYHWFSVNSDYKISQPKSGV